MSVEFYLRDGSLNREKWNSLLSEWSDGLEDELYDEASFDDEDEPCVRISGTGSTRGFGVMLTSEGANFRLDALASRDDWRRCYSLCAAALNEGGGMLEREDGQIYAKPRLAAANAVKDCDEDFAFTAKALKQQIVGSDGGKAQLPCGHFNLFVSAEDFSGDSQQIATRLATRFERYATAYRPSMLFQDKQGRSGVTYGPVPTILPKVDFVLMGGEKDDAKPRVILWQDLLQSLGAHAESVGDERVYVPDPAELPQDVHQRLERVSKPSDSLSSTAPNDKEGDDDKDNELGAVLISAPFAALLLVAGSDGSIEEKELKAAMHCMLTYVKSEKNDKTVRAIFAGCIEHSSDILEQVIKNEMGPLPLLAQIRKAMEHHLDPPTQARFAKAVLDVATAAATATGGLLGMFGSKISKDEQGALDLLKALLEGKKR